MVFRDAPKKKEGKLTKKKECGESISQSVVALCENARSEPSLIEGDWSGGEIERVHGIYYAD